MAGINFIAISLYNTTLRISMIKYYKLDDTQQKLISSWFWRLEVQSKGGGTVVLEAVREGYVPGISS